MTSSGVVATYLEGQPGASPEEVQQKLLTVAVAGGVGDDSAVRRGSFANLRDQVMCPMCCEQTVCKCLKQPTISLHGPTRNLLLYLCTTTIFTDSSLLCAI